ncbi:hypothetical protein ACGF3C_23325 [Micromonospora sp. NPDC047762]|uniref:hypothetical protein n=1 Tax=unclassified Micromonospora TaxID=2617518 RepID=UPI0033FE8F66
MTGADIVLLGADRVIVIDRLDNWLQMAQTHLGVETLNYEQQDVSGELLERSGGRGPDAARAAAWVMWSRPAATTT